MLHLEIGNTTLLTICHQFQGSTKVPLNSLSKRTKLVNFFGVIKSDQIRSKWIKLEYFQGSTKQQGPAYAKVPLNTEV